MALLLVRLYSVNQVVVKLKGTIIESLLYVGKQVPTHVTEGDGPIPCVLIRNIITV